jgi:hypothetical protein
MESDQETIISDFWEDLSVDCESPPKGLFRSTTDLASIFESPARNLFLGYEACISTLRRSKASDEKELRLAEQEKIRSYIHASIEKLKSKHDSSLSPQRAENNAMKAALSNFDADNKIIFQYLIDNELAITEHRIGSLRKTQAKTSRDLERKALGHEISIYKARIEAMKRNLSSQAQETEALLSAYRDKAEALPAKKPEMVSQATQTSELQLFLSRSRSSIKNSSELPLADQHFLAFKAEKLQEVEILEGKCELNKKTIAKLQQELKSAKEILKNSAPSRIIHPNLQGYLEDLSFDPALSSSHSSKNGMLRRRVYSSKAASQLCPSTLNTSIPSPKTSNFKFYSKKPTLSTSRSRGVKSELFLNKAK